MKKIKITEKSWACSLCGGCEGIGATAEKEKDRGKTVTVDTVESWVEWYGPLARWTSLLSFRWCRDSCEKPAAAKTTGNNNANLKLQYTEDRSDIWVARRSCHSIDRKFLHKFNIRSMFISMRPYIALHTNLVVPSLKLSGI